MLSILIAFFRACVHFLKVIERWSYRNRVDRATQTDVSMTFRARNIPKGLPIPTAPPAPPPPVERPVIPTPTMVGKAAAKVTATVQAKALPELAENTLLASELS